jgi:hypothetical protein
MKVEREQFKKEMGTFFWQNMQYKHPSIENPLD